MSEDHDEISQSFSKFTSSYVERNNDATSSEQHLYSAIIIQAMLDATRELTPTTPPATVSCTREAKVWFQSTSVSIVDWFDTICSSAGYNPNLIRSFYNWLTTNNKSLNRRKVSSLIKEFQEDAVFPPR